jgi:hypothetical protein
MDANGKNERNNHVKTEKEREREIKGNSSRLLLGGAPGSFSFVRSGVGERGFYYFHSDIIIRGEKGTRVNDRRMFVSA